MDYCFSPPTFLSTGDKWRQPPHLPAKWRDKSRNFVTCSSKKGKTAANFGDGPCDYRGAYGGEPYVEYDKMMGKVRKASKQKFRTPEGFRYASQRPEAFGKGIEYKPEGGYDPVKRRDTIAPRNVGTAKGRSRNETITGQPMVTYSTDPFEATDIQLKKEQDHHKELCAKIGSARPYSSATCANRAFGKVENEPETDKPLYAKDNTRPWTRSGPFRRAVKGGEMFCPVPDPLAGPTTTSRGGGRPCPCGGSPSPSRRGTCRRPSRSGRPSGRRTRSPRRARRACCLSPGPRGASNF